MKPESAEKKSVRLTICNQSYSLLTSEDPAEIEQTAQTVDELITSLVKHRHLDITRAAVFACLHFAGELRALQQEIDAQSRRMAELLDEVVGSGQ